MLKDTKSLPAVAAMLEKAKDVLGYDLLDVCLNGPKSKLDDTVFSQPALFVAGLAAVEKLRAESPATVEGAAVAAGLSLGEYTALVFAGAMSFEDGLRVVKVRAESMAAAARQGRQHSMLSVIGVDDDSLAAICEDAKRGLPADTVCSVANFLFPQGRVVSGHKDALDKVADAATKKGALKTSPVAVSGAFHTQLMAPAEQELRAALATVKFRAPRIPVISNVTGRPLGSPEDIPSMLCRQMLEPVQWESTIKARAGAGFSHKRAPEGQTLAEVKLLNLASMHPADPSSFPSNTAIRPAPPSAASAGPAYRRQGPAVRAGAGAADQGHGEAHEQRRVEEAGQRGAVRLCADVVRTGRPSGTFNLFVCALWLVFNKRFTAESSDRCEALRDKARAYNKHARICCRVELLLLPIARRGSHDGKSPRPAAEAV